MPTVSVIIPTYKHRDYVLQTLDSVFAQTFTDYEVIVINDGSPDDTAEVLRPLAQTDRIRYIEQPNAGQSSARNRGIAAAKGEYIALLDDDDLWLPDKLEWHVAALEANPTASMIYGCCQTFGNSTPLIWPGETGPAGNAHRAFLEQNWIITPGQTLIRATKLKEVGNFDSAIWGADDWDLYIRLAKVGEFVYRPDICLQYRLHEDNASRDVWRMYVNSCRVQHKHIGLLPRLSTRRVWRSCRRFISNTFYPVTASAAERCLETKDYKKARKLLLQSIRINPRALTQGSVWKNLLATCFR